VTTLLDDELEIEQTMAAVDRASGFLRRSLAKVIDMRHCPSLLFAYDSSISDGAKMSALIDKALNSSR
jgi:ribosome-binding factor A